MSNICDFQISVLEANDSELYRNTLAHINDYYMSAFGVCVEPSDYLVTAHQQNIVLGTLGINFYKSGDVLRLARLYRFNKSCLAFPATSDISVEFGRWTSSIPTLSLSLMRRAVGYSIENGKQYGWCEHSKAVNRAARRFGVKFFEVDGAKVILELVEPEYLNYYQQIENHLYLIELSQAMEALTSFTQ